MIDARAGDVQNDRFDTRVLGRDPVQQFLAPPGDDQVRPVIKTESCRCTPRSVNPHASSGRKPVSAARVENGKYAQSWHLSFGSLLSAPSAVI
ncbi:hypothetical protein [Streptomyces olivaceoviridis]|uniref:hypothetical protein n=1 Tax=Streptomyces olivaceoviridis TaxID=1921 RepID=UPI001E60A287|nr:hypothetical protein [Streptomyces olivaceoviridis]